MTVETGGHALSSLTADGRSHEASNQRRPILSLILCSRNDRYMGDSRWRLETTLNYTVTRIDAIGRTRDVEIVVADWGSNIPLREIVRLTPPAASLTRFLTIPPDVAGPLQKDSPFPEVLALNAAARRARGTYIGRIDQDTLVGERFLRTFFDLAAGGRTLHAPLEQCLLYSNRRDIPYRFAAQRPPLGDVERFVRWFGSRLPIPRQPGRPFWTYWVGIWLAHRARWDECGGYDERMLYYNWMEVDMVGRLATKYSLVDAGQLSEFDFYHLEHVHPRSRVLRRGRKNAGLDWGTPPAVFNPNGPDWGLAGLTLEMSAVSETRTCVDARSAHRLTVLWCLAVAGSLMLADRIANASSRVAHRWIGRAERARVAVRGAPLTQWPRVLTTLWSTRKRERRA